MHIHWPQFTTLLLLGVLMFVAHGAESPAAWPLWDGHESTAKYAQRVNLPPAKTLDLGNGVKLEMALIPAGKFVMNGFALGGRSLSDGRTSPASERTGDRAVKGLAPPLHAWLNVTLCGRISCIGPQEA